MRASGGRPWVAVMLSFVGIQIKEIRHRGCGRPRTGHGAGALLFGGLPTRTPHAGEVDFDPEEASSTTCKLRNLNIEASDHHAIVR